MSGEKSGERADPAHHTPNRLVDEFLYGSTYSEFDTRPAAPQATEIGTVYEDVGVGRAVVRTANVIVDDILDGKMAMHAPKPREPYAYTGKPQQQRKAGKHSAHREEEEVTTEVTVEGHTTVVRETHLIEDQIFSRGTGEPSKLVEEGERGIASKHTTNSLVDQFFDNPRTTRIARSTITAQTSKNDASNRSATKASQNLKAPEQSPSKSSERSLGQAGASLANACLFFRLVLKKKTLTNGGLAFSRLLLCSQKGKLLKNRVLSMVSMLNHLRNRKIAQGFSSILCASYRKGQVLHSPRDNKEHTSSTSRLPRTSRNRMDSKERSTANLAVEDDKEQEKKMMALTEQAKEAILKMQRFDRYIYPFESEKHLKIPIENELRRLEKIKSANKHMWNTYYDNELTITCLYNHMKNLYQLNRDLSQIDVLKVQNEELEKRIIETNIQKKKEIDEAKSRNPAAHKAHENNQLTEYKKSNDFLISTLNETNEKARKLLENQLKKATTPHRQLLEVTLDMVNELIQFQQGTNDSVTIQTSITKLIEEQVDSTRTLQHLERQKKTYEKGISEAKTDETRNVNNSLLTLCNYLINLHTKLRSLKGEGSNRFDDTDKLKADLETQRIRIRELEAKIQQLNKEKRSLEDMKDMTVLTTWQTELTQIIERSENKEAYASEIGKQKKLLQIRKQKDNNNRYNSIITLNISLLENMLKKDREIEKLERQIQERPTAPGPTKQLEEKFNKERHRAETAEAEIARISEELASLKQKEKLRDKEKDPLQTQLLEIFKICMMLEEALAKRESELGTGLNTSTAELTKVRKNLETRKKMSPNTMQIVSIVEVLTKILLELDAAEKNRQKEEQKFQLQRTKELNGIDNFTKIFMKLIETQGVRLDDGLINRLRKNLDITRTKLEKGADSPVSDLYDMYRNVVDMQARLIEIMEETTQHIKQEVSSSSIAQRPAASDRKKDVQEGQNKRIVQLEKQLQIEKQRFATRDQEMIRLREAEDSLSKRVQQLEKQLEIQKNRLTMREQELVAREDELKKFRIDIQTKQQQLRSTRGELTSKDQELKRTVAESSKKGDLDSQIRNQKETIQKHVESERSLNRRIGELERAEGEGKRQTSELQRQLGEYQKQIAQLQKQYNDAAREASETQKLNIEANRQLAQLHKQVGETSKSSTDGKTRLKELMDQISDLNRQLKETTNQNSVLSEQNHNLNDQNRQMGGELKELNSQVRDLNTQVRELGNQVRDLSNRQAEAVRTINDLKNRQEQNTTKTIQQSQQTSERLQKDKERLEGSLADLNRQLGELSGRDSANSQQINKLTRDLESANRSLKQKTDEHANEQRESQRLRDELSRVRSETGQKGDDMQRLQNETRVQNMELTRLREQLSKTTIELAKNRDDQGRSVGEVSKLRDEQSRFGAESSKLRDENSKLRQDNASKASELNRLQADLTRLRDELSRAHTELNRLREQANRAKIPDRNQPGPEVVELRNTILVLQGKIGGLENNLHQIRFLEEANRSLKDQNDALRQELILRSKSFQPQQPAANSSASEVSRLSTQLSRIQQEQTRLRTDSERSLSQKQADLDKAQAEVRKLNDIINSNESQFNNLVRDYEILIRDNQELHNNVVRLEHLHAEQLRTIQQMQSQLDGKSNESSTTSNLRAEFNGKEARYLEEIRVLKQEKSNVERDKATLDRQSISRSNEITDLKMKLAQAISQQTQTASNELNRLRSEFTTKQEGLRRTVRQLETREADLKRLVDSNSAIYNQNEQRFNAELNSLRTQLANRSSSTVEIERIRLTHVEKTVVEQKDRELATLQRELAELRRNNPERELQEARSALNRLQAEKQSAEQRFAQKKKDYDVILQELESRSRTHTSKADELERANDRVQQQLAEVEARFEQQSRELERVRSGSISPTEMSSPNSRYMLLMEEKKSVEIEYSKLKALFEKESNFRRELEEKFAAILQEKTRFLEKIDALQRTVHAKELDLLKNYEAREENLRDLINENKKLQRELKIINDKLSAQHKISLKSLEENMAKMEADLSKLRRENATLKDEIEDLEDELAERGRAKTPNRMGSKVQPRQTDEDYDDRYLLKVDGDRMREQIYYLECSNEKLKQKLRQLEDQSVHSVRSGGESYRRISQSRVLGDDRGSTINDKLNEKVKYLERERHTLYQRLKILSVFSRVETDNHAFVHNLNRVLDNILQFLNDSEEFNESFITYGNFISQISQSVTAEDYETYFQHVEDFLKDLFLRTFESKNEILARQAGQLIHFREQMSELVNEQIDYIEEEERATPKSVYSRRNDFDNRGYSEPAGMASFIALQHLFRLYVRAKSPEVLEQIAQLLNINELGFDGLAM